MANNKEEALNIVRKMIADGHIEQDIAEKYFPKLKESEDEKVRKHLISLFEKFVILGVANECETSEIKVDDILAWLENQGEKSDEWKDGDIVRHGGILALVINGRNAMKSNCERITIQYPNEWVKAEPKEREHFFEKLEKQGEHSNFLSKIQVGDKVTRNKDGALVNLSQLKRVAKSAEIQGEQKPADNAEPKFKIGDIITNGKIIGKVDENENNKYHAWFGYDKDLRVLYADIPDIDNWHLWTIQDAKEGDVLANDHHIFILRELGYNWASNGNSDSLYAYCGIKPNGNFELEQKGYCFCGTLHTHPATKEQRDLLFKKMKEAGYEWDAEKKELKEIVQKSTVWSEEDERMYRGLHNLIYSTPYCDSRKEFSDWFKSLKDRVGCEVNGTTTKEWNDEDGKMLDEFIKYCEYSIAYNGKNSEHAKTWEKRKSWLKSLRPQSKSIIKL